MSMVCWQPRPLPRCQREGLIPVRKAWSRCSLSRTKTRRQLGPARSSSRRGPASHAPEPGRAPPGSACRLRGRPSIGGLAPRLHTTTLAVDAGYPHYRHACPYRAERVSARPPPSRLGDGWLPPALLFQLPNREAAFFPPRRRPRSCRRRARARQCPVREHLDAPRRRRATRPAPPGQ
jgi:hypothetical protein